jgi:carbon monoxide dehydrogenase subunit G
MRFNGEYVLKSGRGAIWTFLTDPGAVSICIPDVEEVRVLDGSNFNAVAKVGIGFIRQKFKFSFTFANLSEPTHAELNGRGVGSGSMIDFHSKIDLVELDESNTKLVWSAEVSFMGPLGGMAGRFVPDAAAAETKRLFDCIRAKVEDRKSGQ